MMRRMNVLVSCSVAAAILCGAPQQCPAEDAAAKKDNTAVEQKQSNKDEKDKNEEGTFRDGVNRAYDEFKKETAKGKKNLNDLYEREKGRSGEEKAK